MKRNVFAALLGGVLIGLMALVVLLGSRAAGGPNLFSSLLAFPFEQIGAGLGALARTGSFGNGAALALCAGLSLLPLLFHRGHWGEREALGEKITLGCLSAALFLSLLGMADPSRLLSAIPLMPGDFLPIMKAMLGGMVWSLVILWLTLRLVRLFRAGDVKKLLGYLKITLQALCLAFAAVIPLSCGRGLTQSLSATQQPMDGVMAVVRFLASALPYGLDIVITLSLLSLLDAFLAGNQEQTAACAHTLCRRCCQALGLTAASVAILNGAQLVLSRFLSNIAVTVDIPGVSLAFLLLILLLSRLILENRKLRHDNDLFI